MVSCQLSRGGVSNCSLIYCTKFSKRLRKNFGFFLEDHGLQERLQCCSRVPPTAANLRCDRASRPGSATPATAAKPGNNQSFTYRSKPTDKRCSHGRACPLRRVSQCGSESGRWWERPRHSEAATGPEGCSHGAVSPCGRLAIAWGSASTLATASKLRGGYNQTLLTNHVSLSHHGLGRGRGVGLGLGVALGVAVGVVVAVAVAVGVALGVAVGVTVGVTVGVGVGLGVGVGVTVAVGVAVGVGVGVAVGVTVGVGV